MKPRSFAVGLLVGAILTLTPLAQASPPDQTWIGGFFDDDDYDNVVDSVTTSVASLTLWPFDDHRRLQSAGSFADSIEESHPSIRLRSSSHTRAPPAS